MKERKNKKAIHVLTRGVIIDQQHILLAYDPQAKPIIIISVVPIFFIFQGAR